MVRAANTFRWVRSDSFQIFDKKSVTLGLAGKRKMQIAMYADHRDIYKFAQIDGDDYKQVADNLIELAGRAVAGALQRRRLASFSSALLTSFGGKLTLLVEDQHSSSDSDLLSIVETSQTPLEPSSAVSFRRDPNFIDRSEIFAQMHERCQVPASQTVLLGLGGIG